jgi:hypothetical protein
MERAGGGGGWGGGGVGGWGGPALHICWRKIKDSRWQASRFGGPYPAGVGGALYFSTLGVDLRQCRAKAFPNRPPSGV